MTRSITVIYLTIPNDKVNNSSLFNYSAGGNATSGTALRTARRAPLSSRRAPLCASPAPLLRSALRETPPERRRDVPEIADRARDFTSADPRNPEPAHRFVQPPTRFIPETNRDELLEDRETGS